VPALKVGDVEIAEDHPEFLAGSYTGQAIAAGSLKSNDYLLPEGAKVRPILGSSGAYGEGAADTKTLILVRTDAGKWKYVLILREITSVGAFVPCR
jgi:hypothetical protein